MTTRRIKQTLLLTLFAFSVCHTNQTYADNYNHLIEYSQSFDIDTFESVKSIGLYTKNKIRRGEVIYGGLQFSQFKFLNNTDSSGIFRVVIGVTTTGRINPYIEISTDLLSALIDSSNDDNQNNCNNETRCTLDGFFRAGIRFEIMNRIRFGIFHEVISFGNNHNLLKDDHDQTGLSISYDFKRKPTCAARYHCELVQSVFTAQKNGRACYSHSAILNTPENG